MIDARTANASADPLAAAAAAGAQLSIVGTWVVVGLTVPEGHEGTRDITLRPAGLELRGVVPDHPRLVLRVTWSARIGDGPYEIKLGDECEMGLVFRRRPASAAPSAAG